MFVIHHINRFLSLTAQSCVAQAEEAEKKKEEICNGEELFATTIVTLGMQILKESLKTDYNISSKAF